MHAVIGRVEIKPGREDAVADVPAITNLAQRRPRQVRF